MKKSGGITVFLTLMLSVLSAFILVLAKSVRTYISKSEAAYAVDNAVRSCFAEYNRELFDRFHILLIDSSYKNSEAAIDRITEHFSTYLENSMTGCVLCKAEIEEYKCAGEDGNYLYDSAVRYARSEMSVDDRIQGDDDDACFLTYLVSILGNDEIPCDRSYRKGELEYLLYGNASDDENIMWAHMDHAEGGAERYDDFLCLQLVQEDISVVKQRFSALLTEYMRANESPGFDLDECCYELTFSAKITGADSDIYTVTREYAYEPQ